MFFFVKLYNNEIGKIVLDPLKVRNLKNLTVSTNRLFRHGCYPRVRSDPDFGAPRKLGKADPAMSLIYYSVFDKLGPETIRLLSSKPSLEALKLGNRDPKQKSLPFEAKSCRRF